LILSFLNVFPAKQIQLQKRRPGAPAHIQIKKIKWASASCSQTSKMAEQLWRRGLLKDLLFRWPLIQQIKTGANGTGPEAMSEKTRTLETKHHGAEVARSICPYCAVGCGQLVFHKNGKLVSIEGDPQSPVSRGHLCPKGADTFEMHTHPDRLARVKYRRPYSREWEEIDLETAMDMVADRLWEARDKSFEETREGKALMQTTAVAHLGGATLDNEENYLIKKLFTGGLGMVCLSNQARI
jgi:formate dehydrogenase major subunit